MPAFGFLLIIAGIFLLVNVFNGNLTNLVQGKVKLNFSGTSNVSSTIADQTASAIQQSQQGASGSGYKP